MGLLPRLRQTAYTLTEVDYVDRSGKPRASLDYRRIVKSLDGGQLSLARGDLAPHSTGCRGLSPGEHKIAQPEVRRREKDRHASHDGALPGELPEGDRGT